MYIAARPQIHSTLDNHEYLTVHALCRHCDSLASACPYVWARHSYWWTGAKRDALYYLSLPLFSSRDIKNWLYAALWPIITKWTHGKRSSNSSSITIALCVCVHKRWWLCGRLTSLRFASIFSRLCVIVVNEVLLVWCRLFCALVSSSSGRSIKLFLQGLCICSVLT